MPAATPTSRTAAALSNSGTYSSVWAAVLTLIAVCGASVAHAKTPGTVHCYGGFCHYIHSVDEMDAMVGRRGYVKASYYDDCKRDRFNPCGLTSSGAIFHPDRPDNAASPIFPDGTVLLTYNPETRLAAVLRVTSAGPYRDDRTLDVSRATAERLGFQKRGVAALEVAILKSPEDHEARYSKLRTYAPVPGFLGRFETFDAAHDAAIAKMQLDASGLTVAALGETQAITDSKIDIDGAWPRALAIEIKAAPGFPDAADSPATINPLQAHTGANIYGPEQLIVATHVTESDLTVPARVDLGAAFAGVFKTLRDKARLPRDAEPHDARDVLEASDLTLIERLKSFVRAAQVRARLGARGRDGNQRSWQVAID